MSVTEERSFHVNKCFANFTIMDFLLIQTIHTIIKINIANEHQFCDSIILFESTFLIEIKVLFRKNSLARVNSSI